MIPWDDDVNICISVDDGFKLYGFKEKMKEQGLDLKYAKNIGFIVSHAF